MKRLAITIPAGLEFSDLKLSRDPVTGPVSFDWEPIEAICAASGIDHEDDVASLIIAWYAEHLLAGGSEDPKVTAKLPKLNGEDPLPESIPTDSTSSK